MEATQKKLFLRLINFILVPLLEMTSWQGKAQENQKFRRSFVGIVNLYTVRTMLSFKFFPSIV